MIFPGTPGDAAHTLPSLGSGMTLYGSTSSAASTFGSIRPSPFESRYAPHQPWEASMSPLSSKSLVLIQPSTLPRAGLRYSVLSASRANWRWCVRKHVGILVKRFVEGSYIETCRVL
jgi:hypothetical protein